MDLNSNIPIFIGGPNMKLDKTYQVYEERIDTNVLKSILITFNIIVLVITLIILSYGFILQYKSNSISMQVQEISNEIELNQSHYYFLEEEQLLLLDEIAEKELQIWFTKPILTTDSPK